MRIDGFRFDLATILGRELHGFEEEGRFLDACRQDPALSEVKLIAEPWDLGPGGYQVGRFSPGWAEWNDAFRDTVRAYWRGDAGKLPSLASRLTASADLFAKRGRKPWASVNFVTAHDGFTLEDLVSYTGKHNEANGEENRDGAGENYSANYGTDGPSDDPAVIALRQQQKRNLLVALLAAQGTPMLLAGDEFGRTQRGNNNAYCQDNEVSWFDWDLLNKYADVHRFVRLLAQRRVLRDVEYEHRRTGLTQLLEQANKEWHGVKLHQPDWSNDSRSMAVCGELRKEGICFHLILNAYWESLEFELPKLATGTWRRWIDTALESPNDIVPWDGALPVSGEMYRVADRSAVMLLGMSKMRDQ
jgi:glycogen operon protein